MKKNKKGFTLIEMLLAISILAILSSSILVAISAQRKKARATRMLSELSGVIQPVEMCLADGGNINSPHGSIGNGDICSLSSAYGYWPEKQDDFNAYVASDLASFASNGWFVYLDDSDNRVCCNSHMIGCKRIDSGANCNSNNP